MREVWGVTTNGCGFFFWVFFLCVWEDDENVQELHRVIVVQLFEIY